MSLELIVWLGTTVTLLILLLIIITVRHKHNYFIRNRIPGPPPTFLLGNLGTLWQVPQYFRQLEAWTKQYGKIYGIFEGILPIYVVSDVNFLEQVFIKQFSNFSRRKPQLAVMPDQEKQVHLFNANDMAWRRQRHVINPTFSKAKLTQMMPVINRSIDELIDALSPYAGNNMDINVRPVYTRLAMDTVCRCAFSYDANVQKSPNNPYLTKLIEFLSVDNRKLLFVKVGSILPTLCGLVLRMVIGFNVLLSKLNETFSFVHFSELPLLWIVARIGEHVVRARRDTNTKDRVDLLYLMLDAATDQINSDENKQQNKSIEASLTLQTTTVHKMTYDEITSNVFLFLLAGTETTSTTLAFCTYVMATHFDVQQKLQDEIDANIDNCIQPLTYEIVEKLEYLDMFIKEVNRMFPIVPIVTSRTCIQDTTIGNYIIKKGTVVQADVYSVHYDNDLWGPVDSYKFHPERHAIKRHPLAYLSFGAGPRNCVGMRFALLQLKMTCIRLLKKFTVLKSDKLDSTFRIIELTSILPESVWIKLEHRIKVN